MIWFFLAGMIAGAVGVTLLAGWWMRSHATRVTPEEAIQELTEIGKQKEEEESHD